MDKKNGSRVIGVAFLGISILFAHLFAMGGEASITGKGQLKKIIHVTNEHDVDIKTNMDYPLVPITRLIGMADVIVIGSVGEVGDSHFTFQVDQVLLNHITSKSLSVTKRIPFGIIPPRVLPYERGQRFALFLVKPKMDDVDQSWKILGIAGEGEMPIEGEYVYFGPYDLKGLEHQPHKVQGITGNYQRFNLNDFKDAVKNYSGCFSWELVEYIKNNKKRTRWIPSKVCDNEVLKNYQRKSWLHDYLVKNTVKRIPPRE
jgi:hypothetical protein